MQRALYHSALSLKHLQKGEVTHYYKWLDIKHPICEKFCSGSHALRSARKGYAELQAFSRPCAAAPSAHAQCRRCLTNQSEDKQKKEADSRSAMRLPRQLIVGLCKQRTVTAPCFKAGRAGRYNTRLDAWAPSSVPHQVHRLHAPILINRAL